MEDTTKLPQSNNENTGESQQHSQIQQTSSLNTSSSSTQPPTNPEGSSPKQTPPKKGFSLLKGIIIFMILLFLVGIGVTAWYLQVQIQKDANHTTRRTQSAATPEKQLIIGTDPTFKPMEFTENDKLVGYDIDLANFLAKEMNTTAVIKSIAFDDLFTALEKSQIDLIISGVTITEDRKQKYAFSTEYLNAGQVIITKKDDQTIRSTVDLKGKKIAVQNGTTNESEAAKYTDAASVLAYPDFELATKSLVNGQADAIFTDLPNAKDIINANPTLKIASDPFTNEQYGIVLRKNDPNIRKVNAALKDLRVKGILTDLKQKWLD